MKMSFSALEDWAIGIDRRTRSLMVLGVVLLLLVVAGIGTVFALFTGQFTKYDAITVRLPASSTAALPGSAVQYDDVSIGKVVGQARTGPDGTSVVDVHVNPGQLQHIPASVEAAVTPISIFGNQYVVLTAPQPSGSTLRPGAVVQARVTAPTSSVQQTIISIDRLSAALRPAQLNIALTAVAQALQGQGTSLGQTATIASAYLGAMQPLWPTIVQDLGLLAPVANQIAASSPDIVGILGNSLTTGATLNQNADALRQLLRESGNFSEQADLFSTQIERPFSLVSAASGPFFSAVAQRPDNISRLLDGLNGFSTAVAAAGRSGPFLSTTATIDVQNPANLATAALGGPGIVDQLAKGLGSGLVNPPTYTSADRAAPTTAAVSAGATSAAATTGAQVSAAALAAAPTGTVVPALDANAERDAISAILSALRGGRQGSADAGALLLSPLLTSLGQQQ